MAIYIFGSRKTGEQRIVFTGRGNNEEEATQSAHVRYSNWQLMQTQAHQSIKELRTSYTHKKRNDVHYKCELTVNYLLVNPSAEKNKNSFFALISNYLRTIMPKRFYSKNNLTKK